MNICPELRFAHLAPDAWSALEKLPRTGWVMWNVPDPETVAEHTITLRKMAWRLQPELGLSEDDFGRLLDMLEVHDWGESIIGDIAFERHPESDRDQIKQEKAEAELQAMETICHPLGTDGEYILDLFKEMESQETSLSHIAYHIDKTQAVLQASLYEKMHDAPGLTKEFYDTTIPHLSIPLFQELTKQALL